MKTLIFIALMFCSSMSFATVTVNHDNTYHVHPDGSVNK